MGRAGRHEQGVRSNGLRSRIGDAAIGSSEWPGDPFASSVPCVQVAASELTAGYALWLRPVATPSGHALWDLRMSDMPEHALHLVTVWNPSYATDALEAHVQRLLHHVRAAQAGAGSWDDAYVWWGRVRSNNRQQPLEHLPQVLALNADLAERGELQLYLTDYRSLYVAEVLEVASGELQNTDRAHVPAYYRDNDLHCDCWFKLGDIRALVVDDTLAVQDELRQLRVVSYNDRPVSLYGGMVNLPLIVRRPDGARFFDDDEYDAYNDGQLWVEADADRGALGGVIAELRDNVLGVRTWQAMLPSTRLFVATAERLMREYRRDQSFDFSTVLVQLCKAIEVQLNALLVPLLATAPPEVRYGNEDGRSVDYAVTRTHTAGRLVRLLTADQTRMRYFVQHLHDGVWVTESLAAILDDLAPLRNDAAHSARWSRDQILAHRNQIVGVGCEGVLVQLMQVRRK